MTLKQWLAVERLPGYSGINARQTLKGFARVKGDAIDRKIGLNLIDQKIRGVGECLKPLK